MQRRHRRGWRVRVGLQLGLLTAGALMVARSGPPTAAAAPGCTKEAECGFKKPLVLFVLDYSTAMNGLHAGQQTRWQAARAAIEGLLADNAGLLGTHFMPGLLRYGHDPDPKAPGTTIVGDTSGLVDGTALDVAPYDLLAPGHPYHDCTNADAIVAALTSLPPPLSGEPGGIDRWTRGGLLRAQAVLAQAKLDHPDELGQRPAAIVLLTAGAWTGPAGGAPLVPASENPAITANELYSAGVPTHVVTLGEANEAPFADDLAAAGGTGEPLDITCPAKASTSLLPLGPALAQEIGSGQCGEPMARAMLLLDASSSLLNINGGAQHAPPGEGLWDQLRAALAGSDSIFVHELMGDPMRPVEDLAYVGVAVFGSAMPAEEKLVLDYAPCAAANIAWALDPGSSCLAGCLDPYGAPPIQWTFQDGSLVDPMFDRKTLSHMPRCDLNPNLPKACVGSASYTHRGLQLVADNLASYKQACMQPGAPDPCTEDTRFFNVLIADSAYNSTDAQVQAPLETMYVDGVVTHVIGFGDLASTQMAQMQLAKLANWGSGGQLAPHMTKNQDQLEATLTTIFDAELAEVALDPCCTGKCEFKWEPGNDEDPDPVPNDICQFSDTGESDSSDTGDSSTTTSMTDDTGDDTGLTSTTGPATTTADPSTSNPSDANTTPTPTGTTDPTPTGTAGPPTTTATPPPSGDASEAGTADPPGETGIDGGCGCTSTGDRTGLLLLLLGPLLPRRRRR